MSHIQMTECKRITHKLTLLIKTSEFLNKIITKKNVSIVNDCKLYILFTSLNAFVNIRLNFSSTILLLQKICDKRHSSITWMVKKALK